MNCTICRNGIIAAGSTTVTLSRDSLVLVVKDVPALVCDNCGEEYVDAEVSTRLLETAEEAAIAGVQVDVRTYAMARQ